MEKIHNVWPSAGLVVALLFCLLPHEDAQQDREEEEEVAEEAASGDRAAITQVPVRPLWPP